MLCSSLRRWRIQQLLDSRGVHIAEIYQNRSRIQAWWSKSPLGAHSGCNHTLVAKEVGILNHNGLQRAFLQSLNLLGLTIEAYRANAILTLVLLNCLGHTVSRHLIIRIDS